MQLISEAITAGSLEDIAAKAKAEEAEREAAKRREAFIESGAKVVEPYEPNRKQRRAMEARYKTLKKQGKVK